MSLSTFLRHAGTAAATAAFAAALSVAAPQSAQAGLPPAVDTFVTYQFTGSCVDCYLFQEAIGPIGATPLPAEGIGTATLVLKNFTGGEFDFLNFVSFSYQSVILSYDSTAPGETLVSANGSIPGNTGGPGNIFLSFLNENTEVPTTFEAFSFLQEFFSELSLVQEWCIGNVPESCQQDNNDFGFEYTLSQAPGAAVPEPATLALLGPMVAGWGLLGLGLARRKRA